MCVVTHWCSSTAQLRAGEVFGGERERERERSRDIPYWYKCIVYACSVCVYVCTGMCVFIWRREGEGRGREAAVVVLLRQYRYGTGME